MTRKSRREIERELADIEGTGSSDGPDRIILTETVVGTEHEASDLEPGETETREREIEL